MGYWTDKVALVTGGSAGLGLELARQLGSRGARVVIAARDPDRLRESAESLDREVVGKVTCFQADVTVQEDVDRLFDCLLGECGRIDLLVNNVGRSSRGRALETSPEQFQASWDVNFLSVVRCTRAAMDQLLAARGHLVNIASLAGKTGSPLMGAYAATKFPVVAYSQQLRLELADSGVHVLVVCPGPIARDDAARRYGEQAEGLPERARLPGGGVRIKGIPPARLAAQILTACEKRKVELVIPWRARLLLSVAQLSPSLGDWIVGRMTR